MRTVIAVEKGDEDLVSYLSGLIGTLTVVKYHIVAFYFFHKITFHSYFLYNRTVTIHLKHFQNLTKIYVLYMEMTHKHTFYKTIESVCFKYKPSADNIRKGTEIKFTNRVLCLIPHYINV